MRVATICSGIESHAIAYKRLNWKPVFFSEINKFASKVLQYHYPDVKNLGNIEEIDGIGFRGCIDIIIGGTPCQGFSSAGKMKGLRDDRSKLAISFVRLLSEIRPKWFIWENVSGALSTNGGRDFARIIQAFNDAGYFVAWRVLDAQWVRTDSFPHAIPHRRRRVFVVGYFGESAEYPTKVLFDKEVLRGDTKPVRIKKKGITTDITNNMRINSFRECGFGEFTADNSCGTLKASGGQIGYGGETIIVSSNILKNTLLNDSIFQNCINELDFKARRLTPIECERLLGFPDDFTRIPWLRKSKEQCVDSPRYKVLGNAICVNVLDFLFERINNINKNTLDYESTCIH